MKNPVFFPFTLKDVLKRGALVAAANWPVAIVQATADSLFKLLIAAPLIGGVFLVALVVGAEPVELMSLEWRQLATTIASTLLVRPAVLAAWVAALAVVLVGGSLFVFLVKGGTVGVLARGERHAGLIERPPLMPESIGRASAFSIETFIECASRAVPALCPAWSGFERRLSGLGQRLLCVARARGGRRLGSACASDRCVRRVDHGRQSVLLADPDCDCGRRLLRRRRHQRASWRFCSGRSAAIGGVFLIILGLVALATGASVLATAALWLVGFVPFIGLTVLPLQLLAWVLRGLVFQFIALASVGAYLKIYRTGSAEPVVRPLAPVKAS